MKTPKTALKFYRVTVRYRTCGYPGIRFDTVKAESQAAAGAKVVSDLRAKEINLKIEDTQVALSGWNR